MNRILFSLLTFYIFLLSGCKPGSEFTGPMGHLVKKQPGISLRTSSANPNRSSNRDMVNIKPGEKLTLANINGSGSIRHLWMTFPAPDSSWLCTNGCSNHSQLVIRMYWDNALLPAVEAPVGDFFASGFGIRASINSVPIIVEGDDSYNCYWSMPFFKSARIEIENQGEKPSGSFYYQVDYQLQEKHQPKTPYFCAQYRQEFPCAPGRDYLILDAIGTGHYVGTILSGRSRSPEWFGEGDDKFYVDGDKTPTIQGTGTEDFALHAWGFEHPTSYPYFGVPILEGEWGMVGWKISMYRWQIIEPISFKKSLRVEIEDAGWISKDEVAEGTHVGFVERNDDFSSVAFWYQVGQPRQYTTLPSAKERELPNIDLIIEGSEILKSATYSMQTGASLQKGYLWTGLGQVYFNIPSSVKAVDSWMQCDFLIEKEELRQLTLRMTKASDYGIYRIILDGKTIHDWYDFFNQHLVMSELNLGQLTLTPGKHTIRFECVGKNSNSQNYGLGFDSIRLRERWNIKRKKPLDL